MKNMNNFLKKAGEAAGKGARAVQEVAEREDWKGKSQAAVSATAKATQKAAKAAYDYAANKDNQEKGKYRMRQLAKATTNAAETVGNAFFAARRGENGAGAVVGEVATSSTPDQISPMPGTDNLETGWYFNFVSGEVQFWGKTASGLVQQSAPEGSIPPVLLSIICPSQGCGAELRVPAGATPVQCPNCQGVMDLVTPVADEIPPVAPVAPVVELSTGQGGVVDGEPEFAPLGGDMPPQPPVPVAPIAGAAAIIDDGGESGDIPVAVPLPS